MQNTNESQPKTSSEKLQFCEYFAIPFKSMHDGRMAKLFDALEVYDCMHRLDELDEDLQTVMRAYHDIRVSAQ